MIQQDDTGLLNIFAAQAATGTGIAHDVSMYDKVYFRVGTASSANLTVKFQISLSNTQPDFSSAASATNHWTYVDVIDALDGASIDGGTGLAPAGTDTFRNLEMNFGHVKWVCATVTARSAGSVTVDVMGATKS